MSFETGDTTPSAESNPAEVAQQTPEESVPAIPQNILDSQQLINAAADSVRKGFRDAIHQPAPADTANFITVPEFAKLQEDALQLAQSNLVPHVPAYIPPKL